MSTVAQAPATLDDLAKVEGKAELINGRIVPLMAASRIHNRVAANIYVSLRQYAKQKGVGMAFTDNMGFGLRPRLPNGRESFSPDAAYHAGPFPADEWTFVFGGPTLAVEVRSSDDYGPIAEREMAEKRSDYFAAGTGTVWDVDPAPRRSPFIAPLHRLRRRFTGTARRPTPSPPCPVGGWPLTTFSLECASC